MTTHIFAYHQKTEQLMHPNLKELRKLLLDDQIYVWVCMDEDGPLEREILEDVFHIHPLLIEDAFNHAQTPKIEDHGDYLYIILHGLTETACATGRIETSDLDVFLGKNFLLTHYQKDLSSVSRAQQALERDPQLLGRGPAMIAHRLIDHMIDQYFPFMERLDVTISELEEMILNQPKNDPLARIFELKRDIQKIRRVGIYQREILHRLWRGDFHLVPEQSRPFFRDVYDHFARITDETESYRENVNSALEAHRNAQSHRLNEIMKLLTLISTVMLPLNFITGLYGMNFDQMPGLHWRYGYATAWFVMLSTVSTFIWFFRRKKWVST